MYGERGSPLSEYCAQTRPIRVIGIPTRAVHTFFISVISAVSDVFASPKSMLVFRS